MRGFQSGRRDSNSGPLVPQTSALTRLRHAPRPPHASGHPASDELNATEMATIVLPAEGAWPAHWWAGLGERGGDLSDIHTSRETVPIFTPGGDRTCWPTWSSSVI